jgi:hypothetical protein
MCASLPGALCARHLQEALYIVSVHLIRYLCCCRDEPGEGPGTRQHQSSAAAGASAQPAGQELAANNSGCKVGCWSRIVVVLKAAQHQHQPSSTSSSTDSKRRVASKADNKDDCYVCGHSQVLPASPEEQQQP